MTKSNFQIYNIGLLYSYSINGLNADTDYTELSEHLVKAISEKTDVRFNACKNFILTTMELSKN